MYEISKIQSNRFLNDKNVFTISQKLRSTNPKEIIASDYEKSTNWRNRRWNDINSFIKGYNT